MVGVAAIVTVAAVGLATSWTGMAAVAILIVNLGFLISIAVKSLPFLVSRDSADHEDNHPGQQDPTLQSTEPHDTELLDPPEWPPVTVLCPMAREDSVCEQLVQSMSELDYPLNKLQVLFIVDDDDEITINAMPDRLPPNMKMLLVPQTYPKCKPRVCNYALWYATGDYLVIFDAEDRVAPNQVKAAVRKLWHNQTYGDGKMAVVQGRLLFDNLDQGLLANFFSIEYDQWHGLIVPALAKFGLPVPLGGTSNYFRRDALEEVGGWDAYNVTEDADVGLRIFAQGWRTGTVPDITYEHAVTKVGAWIKQRSRWTKGYMITAFVHMRRPVELIRAMGFINAVTSLWLVGATPLLMAVAPILWVLYLLSFVFPQFVGPLFPGWFGVVAGITFYGGLVHTVLSAFVAVRPRKNLKLSLLAIAFPIYALLGSISAVIAAYELFVRPHMWRKTAH